MAEMSTATSTLTDLSTANGNLTDLSPEEEKRVIAAFARTGEAEAKEGDTFYVLSLSWWRIWTAYVNRKPTMTTNEGSSVDSWRPQSINNSGLICELSSENSALEIYDTVVEGTHYILVPETIWNRLHAWYGGGPPLPRKVITRGSSQTELTVEVYLLRLQLYFTPRVGHCVIKMSRKETIGALHRKACEIFNLRPYQVQIWDYYGCCKHAVLNDLDETLDDANIQTNQEILVEVTDHSGRHVNVVQKNGYAKNDPLAAMEPSRTIHPTNDVSRTCNWDPSPFQNLSLSNNGGPTPFNRRRSGVGLIGLLNLGNTCFMNTAIQCLVHTPQISKYFLGNFCHEINKENPLGMKGELALAFGDLVRKLWATGGRGAFAPRAFTAKLARFAPQFNGHNQHDSQELLAFLLDGLHEDLNRVRQKPCNNSNSDTDGLTDDQLANEHWANHISRNDSIIVDVCQGQYKSTLTCPECNKVSVTFDPFMYLSLPIESATPQDSKNTTTIFTCIEAFLHEEPLVPEDMWFCPRCKERRQASKKLDLWKLPEVLVIHLKRFLYTRTMKSKVDTFVNFPLCELDLTKYVANSKNNPGSQVYELYAVTNHYGNMAGGHYTAFVKLVEENRWYNFDDSRVSAISEDVVRSNAAYVLFYRRVSNGADVSPP